MSYRQISSFMFVVCCLQSGCFEYDRKASSEPPIDENPPLLFTGLGQGQMCSDDQECRRGLVCEDQTCVVRGDAEESTPCLISAECQEGLRCGWTGFCVEEGSQSEGDVCGHDGECKRGFSCERVGGIAGQCIPVPEGGEDVYGECETAFDCAEGLVCSAEQNICLPGSLLLNPEIFRGVACDLEGEANMPFGVRHALPYQDDDFFATPFPSDLRVINGKVNLSDYPTPGQALTDQDLFDDLLRSIESIRSGWSRNPGIYFRFTRPIKIDPDNPDDLSRHIKLVNLRTGESHPFTASLLPDRNKYICHHALYIHPLWSRPLTPGDPYAALILKTIRSQDEEVPEPLDLLPILLSNQNPTDELESDAWKRYTPLRQWMKESNFEPGSIAGATLFTVRQGEDLFEKGREAVYRANVSVFDGTPVLCQAGTRSPCASPDDVLTLLPNDQRDPRDCPELPHQAYHEIHAKIRVPIFQEGELPYAKQGGGIRISDERPQLKRYESVCATFTIPKTAQMPDEGWPVMIYAHGTSGNFRAGSRLLGAALAGLKEDEVPMPVATVSIDQVMHGPRLGEDQTQASGPLFFNVQNPQAARGNLIQGALDQFALVRFLKESTSLGNWSVESIGPIRFNQDRISYHGHSQGGTVGPLFAPFEDEMTGAVFSGTAGGLIFSLIGKTEPYDSTIGLRLALQELDLPENHPALQVFQEMFDDVDPINYADLLHENAHGRPIHVLHIMGLHDTFTPDRGQRSYAAATGGVLGEQDPPPIDFDPISDLGMVLSPLPIEGNQTVPSVGQWTGVTLQFEPQRASNGEDEYNGHFVVYRNPQALRYVLHFLSDLSQGQIPLIDNLSED